MMKTFFLTSVFLMSVAQADPVATNAPVVANATAADAWQRIVEEGNQLTIDLQAHEPAIMQHVPALQADLKDYVQKFPTDEHVSEAKFMSVQLSRIASGMGLPGAPSKDEVARQFAALADDKSMSVPFRAQAAMSAIDAAASKVKDGGPAAWDAFDARITAFEKDFGTFAPGKGEGSAAAMMRAAQIRMLDAAGQTERLHALLARLASDPQADIAALAQKASEREKAMGNLKKSPLDLKFTAVDGSAFDLAKLRGKVVLLDFWATWCGPCMEEVPNVVTAYEKLHSQGFEIVGISLDRDKGSLDGFIKEHGMDWPQYFDGKGWDNVIVKRFGIQTIPAMWLIGKDGHFVAETDGENLADQVQKLLQAK